MNKLFKLDTRQKIVTSVVILVLSYIILTQADRFGNFFNNEFSKNFISPGILALITYLLTYWIVEFRVKGERFVTILGFPAVGVFVFSFMFELISETIFLKLGAFSLLIISSIVFSIFIYILLLTANILNVSYLEDIPLGQAGRAAYYIINMIVEYMLFMIIIGNDINIFMQLGLIFLVVYFVVTSTLWTIRMRVGKRILIAMSIALLISQAFFVLSIWPIDTSLVSFVMLIILYITLGLALEVREVVTRMIWFEYISLLIIIFLILILFSNWGINGTII